MKRFLKIFIFLFVSFTLVFAYDKAVEGFSIRQIQSLKSFDINPDLEKQPMIVRQVFAQPLKYLGKGCQFYAFESSDSEYVVKFFKHKHLRDKSWLLKLPFPSFLKKKIEKSVQQQQIKIKQLLTSCQIAYEILPEETGVVFLHLNKTDFIDKKASLINKLGMRLEIDADEVEFVIQKKGIASKEYLESNLDDYQLIALLDNLEESISKRCHKGVKDLDKAVIQNLAVTKDSHQILFIDIGQYVINEEIKEESCIKKELLARFESLLLWSQDRCPKLAPFVKNKIKTYIEQKSIE